MNLLNSYGLEDMPVLEECGDERVNIDARNSVTLKKKKQVALIMLIIALQFDVSTSFNM